MSSCCGVENGSHASSSSISVSAVTTPNFSNRYNDAGGIFSSVSSDEDDDADVDDSTIFFEFEPLLMLIGNLGSISRDDDVAAMYRKRSRNDGFFVSNVSSISSSSSSMNSLFHFFLRCDVASGCAVANILDVPIHSSK